MPPFVDDESHIYNVLVDYGISSVDMGVCEYDFQLYENLKLDGVCVDGITEFDERAIKLEMNLDNEHARETIIHEILHCILEHSGLHELNFDGKSIMISNEALVVCLSKHLMQLYRLNPDLFKVIFHNDK